ncbi:MAG: hypothetical protein ACRELV_00095 [Longimicrobiales bacterium]
MLDADVYAHCLFCRAPLQRERKRATHGGPVLRAAYDFDLGRVWAVCTECGRWNLYPLEDRAPALDSLERWVRGRGHLLASTANVSLIQVDDDLVLRVGVAGLAEHAWWRYGRALENRWRAFRRIGPRMGAYVTGAAVLAGRRVGLIARAPVITWDDRLLADTLRRLRFGWLAWEGRTACAYCHSVLRGLPFEDAWWVHPLFDDAGRVTVGVPCPRCDPWTPEKLFRIGGESASLVLRRILAYQNIDGAPRARVEGAAAMIEAAGSAADFGRRLGARRASLWALGPTAALALEIALSEAAERRELARQLSGLEAVWRREEELAAIVDDELTPCGVAISAAGSTSSGSR